MPWLFHVSVHMMGRWGLHDYSKNCYAVCPYCYSLNHRLWGWLWRSHGYAYILNFRWKRLITSLLKGNEWMWRIPKQPPGSWWRENAWTPGSVCGAVISGTRISAGFFPIQCSRYSVVGIAIRYGLNGLGIDFRWERDSACPSRPSLRPVQPPVNGYRVFSGIKRPGRGPVHPPRSSANATNCSSTSAVLLCLYRHVKRRYLCFLDCKWVCRTFLLYVSMAHFLNLGRQCFSGG
jgi:hypothetical protein